MTLDGLMEGFYEAFDPTLVFGSLVIGLTVQDLRFALFGWFLWNCFVEGLDFVTPESEPPPLFDSWLLDTMTEVTIALAALVLARVLLRSIRAAVDRRSLTGGGR